MVLKSGIIEINWHPLKHQVTDRPRLCVSRQRPIQFLFRNRCNLIKPSWKWSSLTARVSVSYLWQIFLSHYAFLCLLSRVRLSNLTPFRERATRQKKDYQYYIYKVSEFKICPKKACSSTLEVYCIILFIQCVEFRCVQRHSYMTKKCYTKSII